MALSAERIKNVRRQLRTKMTRGANPRPLTAEELTALEAEDAEYKKTTVLTRFRAQVEVEVDRAVEAVGAAATSTNAAIVNSRDDVKQHVTEAVKGVGAKRALEEIFCPTAPEGASTQQLLDAHNARHRADLLVGAALRKKRAEEKALEKDLPKKAVAKKAVAKKAATGSLDPSRLRPPESSGCAASRAVAQRKRGARGSARIPTRVASIRRWSLLRMGRRLRRTPRP